MNIFRSNYEFIIIELKNINQDSYKKKYWWQALKNFEFLLFVRFLWLSLCNYFMILQDVRSVKYDRESVEQIYYLTNAAALANCQNILPPDVLKTPTQVLDKKDATIQELYYAVYSLKALGKGSIYDKEDSLKNLIQLLKKDDSPAK